MKLKMSTATLTTTQRANLDAKFCNYYEECGGVGMLSGTPGATVAAAE